MDPDVLLRLRSLRDPAFPAWASLFEHGADLWRAAGHSVEGGATPTHVRWRPGRSLVIRYAAQTAAGEATSFVAAAGVVVPPGTVTLESEAGPVAVWGLSDDPWLPGLRVAMSPPEVRAMLGALGVPPAPVHLQLRAHRPGRRAVVEVVTGDTRLFLKVVRTSKIAALQARHRALEAVLPVPRTHGWSAEHGLIVLEARPGLTLRAALAEGARVPSAAELEELLREMPAPSDGALAASQVDAGLGQIDLLRRLSPARASMLDAIAQDFERHGVERPARQELRPVHGDLHEAQVIVQGGQVSGVLDIDGVGLGDPVDDWATLLAHLEVWRHVAPAEAQDRVTAYARDVAGLVLQETTPADLAPRVASVILGLAVGPFRTMQPDWAAQTDARIDLAASWASGLGLLNLLDSPAVAPTEDESRLIRLSGEAHRLPSA